MCIISTIVNISSGISVAAATSIVLCTIVFIALLVVIIIMALYGMKSNVKTNLCLSIHYYNISTQKEVCHHLAYLNGTGKTLYGCVATMPYSYNLSFLYDVGLYLNPSISHPLHHLILFQLMYSTVLMLILQFTLQTKKV